MAPSGFAAEEGEEEEQSGVDFELGRAKQCLGDGSCGEGKRGLVGRTC